MIVFKIILAQLILIAAQDYVRSHSQIDEEGCWICTNSGDGRYGHMWFLGRRYKAHVLSWLAFRGSLARHHVVDHQECDKTNCCNPEHVQAKSQSANMKRCFAAGRGKSPLIKEMV